MTNRDIEIMAPVGSWESLVAAGQAGANSIYFGVEQLNMRTKSSSANFTVEDMAEIVSRSKSYGMKSYLTLNTIIYDYDLTLMKRIIDQAKAAGVTAIIAADQAVLSYAHQQKVELHISTQANISNIEAVKFYAIFADVVVLARELSLTQVRKIYDAIQEEQIKGPAGKLIEIEMFAHGALCMAVSGKCYLSLHEENSSANRGACLQTCRKTYTVTNKETGYQLDIENENIMSPKDLNTIGFVDQMIEAGVRVLKIEGRARPAEYVKIVSECYRQAADSYVDGSFSREKVAVWNEQLSTVFNRGFWDGYYLGRKIGEWTDSYGSKATKQKVYIGKGTNYFKKLGVAEIKLEAGDLKIGDEILITGPTTGVIQMTISELRVELQAVESAEKGSFVSTTVPDVVRKADKVYKMIPV
ncbi:MAG: hypothetical protein RIS47_1842 [Bacteroidota bacterium]|jgi:putative protease